MPQPTFFIGPTVTVLGWLRLQQQSRRRVKLTVHRAMLQGPFASIGGETISVETDSYSITLTNATRDRDIVVTHVCLDTTPPVHVHDRDLPVRLKPSAPWETLVPIEASYVEDRFFKRTPAASARNRRAGNDRVSGPTT